MSLVATLAQEFRVQSPRFDSAELRVTSAGAHNAFMRQTNGAQSFVTPELAQRAFTSTGRALKMPVINYKDVTIRTTRPLTIAADENTSAFYTVVFTTLAYGFAMYPAQHYNNDIDMQTDFNKKYQAMIVKMKSTLEGLAVTAIDAAKTQVVGEVTGGHTFASNVVSETGIASLKDSYVIHDLDPMMQSNDFDLFNGDIIGNQGLNAITTRMEGFGEFNQEDKTLPFADKFWGYSNSIANAVGKSATGYAITDGTLGMLTRVEPDAIMGTRLGTSHEWGTVEIPMLGVNSGFYSYEAAVDASALGAHTSHLTRTGARFVDFAFDVAYIVGYNSDRATIPSGIVKFDVATA